MKIHKTKLAFSLVEISVVIIIIGILIVGIAQGTLIMRDAKLKTAQNLTNSSPINSMEGLALWLDATDLKTIATGTVASSSYTNNISEGDFVVSWKDRNPQNQNPREISAPADASRPTYIYGGINGLPSFSFDGSADYLTTTPGIVSSGTQAFSFAAVFVDNNPTSQHFLLSQGGSCSGADFGVTTEEYIRYIGCGISGAADLSAPSLTTTSGTPYILIINVDKDKTANQISFYLNQGTSQGSPDETFPLESDIFSIGRSASGNSPFFGLISEIIIFNRYLQSYEVTAIKEYFVKKYNIRN